MRSKLPMDGTQQTGMHLAGFCLLLSLKLFEECQRKGEKETNREEATIVITNMNEKCAFRCRQMLNKVLIFQLCCCCRRYAKTANHTSRCLHTHPMCTLNASVFVSLGTFFFYTNNKHVFIVKY